MKFSAAILLATCCTASAFLTPSSPATAFTSLGATMPPPVNGNMGYTYGGSQSSSPTIADVAVAPKVAQRWRKSTKQVVTLGPASSSLEMIEKLFLAGADVFRLNFSHGSQEQKKDLLDMIRSTEEKYSHPIAILGDLQGPKLRVSTCASKLKKC